MFFGFSCIIGNWVTGSGPSYLWVVGRLLGLSLHMAFEMISRWVAGLCGFGFGKAKAN